MTIDNAKKAFLSAIGTNFKAIEQIQHWKSIQEAKLWVSHFHNRSHFQLPFVPADWVYSEIILIPINRQDTIEPFAYYKRGVDKYRRMIQRGEQLTPITLLYGNNRSGEGISRADGNHRMCAAYREELDFIPAILGVKKTLIESGEPHA